IIVGSFFLPGGNDLYNFYLPFAGGCLNCGFVPYFARWVLVPLTWLPSDLVWPVLVIVSLVILLLTCRYIGHNPLWLLLSFPTLSMIWLGQIDALIIAGLAIALLASSPWLRGVGLSLAAIKPQIAGLAIIVLLAHERGSNLLKILVAPIVVGVVSLLIFGLDWPFLWLANASQVPLHAYQLDVVDPLPYLLAPLIFLFQGRQGKLRAALLITTMASPYFGLYSYTVPLSFGIPGWGVLLSFIWPLAYISGTHLLRLVWIFPIALLVHQYIQERHNRFPKN
ncbi:MAG: glycosyltransferase family 87 protein, partial [Chloroflexota bacterium]